MEYKRLSEKYEKKIFDLIDKESHGENYNIDCKKNNGDPNLYNINFLYKSDCKKFNDLLKELKLTKHNMNYSENLKKLEPSQLMKFAAFPEFWELYLKDDYYDYNKNNEGVRSKISRLIHFAVYEFNDIKYLNFWLKMAEYENLWKIRIEYEVSPLMIAFQTLDNPQFIDFWLKIADHEDLWKNQNISGPAILYIACQTLNNPEFVDFWLKIADYEDIWKIQKNDGSTPLHCTTESLTNPQFIFFWLRMAKYEDLWKIQKNDGSTPLHCTTESLTNPQFIFFWLRMAKYEDLWKIQKNDGSTPLHCATESLTNPQFIYFWLKMADYEDLWKIQDERGTPLHYATIYLINQQFLEFWLKIAEYEDLWKIKNNVYSNIPIKYAVENFPDPEFEIFWIKNGDKFGKILVESYKNLELLSTIRESIFKHLFPLYNSFYYSVKINYYILAHGSLTGSFFKVPKNVTIIFLAKSFNYYVTSFLGKYISGLVNTLETTIKIAKFNNVLRKYKSSDLVPDMTLSFYENYNAKSLFGIMANPNILKKDYLEQNNLSYNDDKEPIDDLGIFKDNPNKKEIRTSLHNIVKWIEKNLDSGKHYTVVVGACRLTDKIEFNNKRLCEYINLIDKTQFKKTRYDDMCENKNIKNKNTENYDDSLQLNASFATPPKSDIAYFSDDLNYAILLNKTKNITDIKIKYEKGELIDFEELISVYRHIMKEQKNKKKHY
jgi:hypothetical protein